MLTFDPETYRFILDSVAIGSGTREQDVDGRLPGRFSDVPGQPGYCNFDGRSGDLNVGLERKMTISQEAHTAIEKLAVSTEDLLRDLEAARDASVIDGGNVRSDAADNVRRYLGMLGDGRAADDASVALRGANLLTTVNKGMGDAEIASEERVLSEKAFVVMKDAITAAAHLRKDAGLPF